MQVSQDNPHILITDTGSPLEQGPAIKTGLNEPLQNHLCRSFARPGEEEKRQRERERKGQVDRNRKRLTKRRSKHKKIRLHKNLC